MIYVASILNGIIYWATHTLTNHGANLCPFSHSFFSPSLYSLCLFVILIFTHIHTFDGVGLVRSFFWYTENASSFFLAKPKSKVMPHRLYTSRENTAGNCGQEGNLFNSRLQVETIFSHWACLHFLRQKKWRREVSTDIYGKIIYKNDRTNENGLDRNKQGRAWKERKRKERSHRSGGSSNDQVAMWPTLTNKQTS